MFPRITDLMVNDDLIALVEFFAVWDDDQGGLHLEVWLKDGRYRSFPISQSFLAQVYQRAAQHSIPIREGLSALPNN